VPPEHVGHRVVVRARVGEADLQVVSPAGVVVTGHPPRLRGRWADYPHAGHASPTCKAEVDAVEQQRLQGRLRFAKPLAPRPVRLHSQPSLDRRLVEDLATLRFVDEKANLLLIGTPGVGKTMLATALGHKAVQAGHRVYYTTTAADLVTRTAKTASEGRWATTMRFWTGPNC
jgi:DNA replication protein DnaC